MQPGDAVKGTWLVAGVWLAAIAGAGPQTSAIVPPPPTATSNDPHQQIQALAQAIDTDRTQLGIAAPVNPMATLSAVRECTPGPSTACHDVCRLDDSICDNAKKICDLADQLTNDE